MLDRDLTASRDRTTGLDLAGALSAIRTAAPKIRIVVVARGELDAAVLSTYEALGFLDLDPVLSARNLDLAEEATALRDAAALNAERIASLERDKAALERDVAALTAQ